MTNFREACDKCSGVGVWLIAIGACVLLIATVSFYLTLRFRYQFKGLRDTGHKLKWGLFVGLNLAAALFALCMYLIYKDDCFDKWEAHYQTALNIGDVDFKWGPSLWCIPIAAACGGLCRRRCVITAVATSATATTCTAASSAAIAEHVQKYERVHE